jgi:hypothetical protein
VAASTCTRRQCSRRPPRVAARCEPHS